MFRFSWLRFLDPVARLWQSHPRQRKLTPAKPRRPRARPWLEALEDRIVPNTAPVVINPGPQTSAEGEMFSLQVQASDADGDSLFYSAGGLPDGVSVNSATGLISGNPR